MFLSDAAAVPGCGGSAPSPGLHQTTMKLRDYQQAAVDQTEAGWGQFGKQLGVLPTGGGKTIVFSHLASRQAGNTLILAHREELLQQAIEKLQASTGLVASLEKADNHACRQARVVVASVQSMMTAKRLASWRPDHFDLIVVDEAHHALSTSYRKVLSHFDTYARVLGVTATPDRGDKKNMGEYFQNIAFEVKLFDLVRAGHLAPITMKSIPLKIDLSSVRQTCGDFSDADLGSALEPYLPSIADAIRKHASFRKILCFLPLIDTSLKFVDACRAAGLAAEHIDGTSEDRAEILERFHNGKFDILSNAMLLTEGYDEPNIDCVVVLRPTKSRPLYAQMVGRGTRTHPEKENLLLLDFLWMHEKHSVVRPAHLISKDEAEAAEIQRKADEAAAAAAVGGEMQEELDLQGLLSTVTSEREASLAKKLRALAEKQSQYLTADQYASQNGKMELADYEPTMTWEGQRPTERQLSWLEGKGIDPESVRSKGHASALISAMILQEGPRPASEAQRECMRRAKHPKWQNASREDATEFFRARDEARRENTMSIA